MTGQGIAALRRTRFPCLNKWYAIDKSSQCNRRVVQHLVIWRTLVVFEVNNLGLIHLYMAEVNLVSVKNDRLMGVRLNAMLVPFTAVIMLRI